MTEPTSGETSTESTSTTAETINLLIADVLLEFRVDPTLTSQIADAIVDRLTQRFGTPQEEVEDIEISDLSGTLNRVFTTRRLVSTGIQTEWKKSENDPV